MFAIRNGNVRTFLIQFKNSRSQMFFEIGALENVAIFTEKHLCWSLFLIKLQAEKHFPVNIANFLGIAFL